jgi:hypothetical protein
MRTEGLGNWREINEAGAKYQGVTAEDIQRVAAKYLVEDQRNVLVVRRKAGTAGAGELTGLTPEQQAFVNKLKSALAGETDAAKLKKGLADMDAREAQADAKAKPLMKIQRALLQQRIAELERGAK